MTFNNMLVGPQKSLLTFKKRGGGGGIKWLKITENMDLQTRKITRGKKKKNNALKKK